MTGTGDGQRTLEIPEWIIKSIERDDEGNLQITLTERGHGYLRTAFVKQAYDNLVKRDPA